MSTKKTVFFLMVVILISFGFMTSLFMNNNDTRTTTDPSLTVGSDPSLNELESNIETKELRIAVSLDPIEFVALERLSNAYDLAKRDISIELENVPEGEAYTEFKRDSQIGDAADIMLLDNTWVNEFAALGYLSAVSEKWMNEVESAQIKPMVSQVKWNGYLWAIPKEIDPYILVWNEDRFNEMAWDHAPKTAEEFIEAEQLFSDTENNKMGIFYDKNDPYAFVSLLWSLGLGWLDSSEQTESIHNKDTIETLETFFYGSPVAEDGDSKDTQQWGIAHNNLVLDDDIHPWELLEKGQIAMIITTLSDFKKNAGEGILMSKLPPAIEEVGNDKSLGGWLKGSSYAVSSRSTMHQEAFEWIQHMSTMEMQFDLMESGGGLPVVLSSYESEKLNSLPYFQDIVDSIEYGNALPKQPELPDKIEILQVELNRLWQGEQTIRQFVEQIELEWEKVSDF